MPIAGDWNGDGFDTVGLYDPATGTYFLKNSNSGGMADITFPYGPSSSTWLPTAGDWNADGTFTIGLYDPGTSTWFLRNANSAGSADLVFTFGVNGAKPIAGRWN